MKGSTLMRSLVLLAIPTTIAVGTEQVARDWTATETWNGETTTITVADFTYSSPMPIPTTAGMADNRAKINDIREWTLTETISGTTYSWAWTTMVLPDRTVTMTIPDITWFSSGTKVTQTAEQDRVMPRAAKSPLKNADLIFTYTAEPQTVTESSTTKTIPAQTFTMTMGDKLVPPEDIADASISIVFSTVTDTYTQVIPATTMSGSTDTKTFTAITQTITWTHIVTSHITIPDMVTYPTPTVYPRMTTFETVTTTNAASG